MRSILGTLAVVAILASTFAAAAQARDAAASKAPTRENASVRKLNRALTGTPMEGLARILETQGRRWDVNPWFVAAVAHKESSLGLAACSSNPRNVWGLGACGRAWSPPYFRTWTQAVNYFVRFVRNRWPSASHPSHFAGYCNGCEWSWSSGVIAWMNRWGEAPYVGFRG